MMVKKFMLIEVIERNVSEPEFFDTHQKAYDEMKHRFEEACDASDEDSYIAEDYAYGENASHDNCDWQIFNIEMPVEKLNLEEFEGDTFVRIPATSDDKVRELLQHNINSYKFTTASGLGKGEYMINIDDSNYYINLDKGTIKKIESNIIYV